MFYVINTSTGAAYQCQDADHARRFKKVMEIQTGVAHTIEEG